ncbi:uncharacterized protein BXZ73DRAFT_104413 [Epithele typhae]|uniref:uncharacterized protein n=1 Tax=Epithele typhae TaxID=378194 RepID=UPI00200821B5|nr:uncharacterized protein BXZ73DRAFT_104413 [Epithele typhae]KAH9921527.1 hypothetical protein BXZ73DRAFT_104413 [Epithele typhae]
MPPHFLPNSGSTVVSALLQSSQVVSTTTSALLASGTLASLAGSAPSSAVQAIETDLSLSLSSFNLVKLMLGLAGSTTVYYALSFAFPRHAPPSEQRIKKLESIVKYWQNWVIATEADAQLMEEIRREAPELTRFLKTKFKVIESAVAHLRVQADAEVENAHAQALTSTERYRKNSTFSNDPEDVFLPTYETWVAAMAANPPEGSAAEEEVEAAIAQIEQEVEQARAAISHVAQPLPEAGPQAEGNHRLQEAGEAALEQAKMMLQGFDEVRAIGKPGGEVPVPV